MPFPILGAGLTFLIIAVAAGLLGFGLFSEEAPLAAKLCSAFFLLLAIASFLWAWMARSPQAVRFVGRGT